MRFEIDTEAKNIELKDEINIIKLIEFLRELDKKYWRDYTIKRNQEVITLPTDPANSHLMQPYPFYTTNTY